MNSSLGLALEVCKAATLPAVKDIFGRCADWSSSALRYLYRDSENADDDSAEKEGVVSRASHAKGRIG